MIGVKPKISCVNDVLVTGQNWLNFHKLSWSLMIENVSRIGITIAEIVTTIASKNTTRDGLPNFETTWFETLIPMIDAIAINAPVTS